ncbi:MAG: CRISPR-associated protein Cas4, partial [Flavobacteriales bacterium]
MFANGIHLEQTSDTVYEGKLIHETSYPERAKKYTEVELPGAKIDHYDPHNKIIHEIKKSNKVEKAHEWQVKYYIWLMEKQGMDGVSGLLEYPKLRKTKEVLLSEPDREYLKEALENIRTIIQRDECPPLEKKSICRSCSYYDF